MRERELVGAPAAEVWKTGAVAKPNAEARAKGRGSGSLAIDWTVTMWFEYCRLMGDRRWRGCCIYWPTTSSFISHAVNEIGLLYYIILYYIIYFLLLLYYWAVQGGNSYYFICVGKLHSTFLRATFDGGYMAIFNLIG